MNKLRLRTIAEENQRKAQRHIEDGVEGHDLKIGNLETYPAAFIRHGGGGL